MEENADWDQGVGTSIRTGVQALCAHGIHSLILTLADLPLLTPDCYNRLFEIHRSTGKTIVASEYSGTVGIPALFVQDVFEELLSLENTQGCKGVLMRHGDRQAGVDFPAAAFDIDTPEDYRRFRTPPPGPRDGIQPSFPPT